MNAPNGNPLTPDSLAADGMQGADAKASKGAGRAQDTPETQAALSLALAAVEAAQELLEAYALAGDDPSPGAVDAADDLDRARAALAGSLTGADHAR
jgi:hypothetical protein